jgi:hypothetical protein
MALRGEAFQSFPKGRPKLLEQRARDADWQARDKAESAKVKVRSKGRCEVVFINTHPFVPFRCGKRASEVHHHIGGWKLRGRGDSALAANKTHCCAKCHREITGHVLEHVSGNRYRSEE